MKTKLSGIITLLLAFVVQITFAQEQAITGTVSDEIGPLPGVSVIIEGISTGTETDFDGNYSITANTGATLRYSFVGMATLSKIVGNQNIINVTMVSESNTLDEVIVTALGIKREAKSLGYSVQAVKGEDMVTTRQTDISTALAGKVSGVQFTGQPTSTFKNANIRLRGSSGVLYVVDGVKLNSSSDINTDEIESMNVLKSLSATALFGPEGRNGAIVIITKKAKSGESSITVNSSVAFDKVYILPEYQDEYGGGYANDGKPTGHPERYTNAIGYFTPFSFNPAAHSADWASFDGDLMPSYFADESWGPKMEGQMVRHWDSWIEGDPEFGKSRAWEANPDGIRNFFQTGLTTNNSVSFAKGGEDFSIRSSIGYISKTLILENTNRETINMSVNAEYKVSKKFRVNTNISYNNRLTENDPYNSYGNLGSNFNQWWQRQLDLDRLKDYRRNGEIVSWNINSATNPKPLYWNSPYFILYENTREQIKNALIAQVGLTYDFTDNISASLSYRTAYNGYNYSNRTGWGGLEVEAYNEGVWNDHKNELFGITNYSKKINDFDFRASAGFEISDITYRGNSSSTVGGMTTPGFYSIQTSVDRPNYSSTKRETENKAWFTTASIGYKNMMYLDGTYRMDYGSTAEVGNNSVSTFGISGAFIFSELFENKNILSFGKLRAGYAEAPYFPNPYQLSQTYATGTPYGNIGTSSVPNAGINPLLTGGTRNEFEYGMTLKFLKNRIGLDLAYFDREDSDLPVSVTIPGSTGITSTPSNDGIQTYKGIEATLSLVPIKNENFTWSLDFNMATLERFVVKIADGVDVTVLSSWGPQLQERKGEEWGSIYGNIYKRDENGNKVLASNGLYERENMEYIGSILPDYTGGLFSNMTYKNFDFSLGFDFQKGGLFYGVSRRYGNFAGLGKETAGDNALGNPVRNTVSGTDKPTAWSVNRANADATSGGHLTSGVDASGNPQEFLVNPYVLWRSNLRNIHEEYVNDASYIKLRTIRLGYNLPEEILSGTPFDKVNFAVFADNVWLIYSELDGVDPSETEGRNGHNWIENGQLPSARSFGFNIKFTF